MQIPVGTTCTVECLVDESNTASAIGSGMVEVFATPLMIARMELAASRCIAPFLNEGQASVGTQVQVTHSAPTPPGMRVIATATVLHVDRSRVEFEVSAADEAGEIGRGTHTRFIIDTQKFKSKAAQRRTNTK